LGEPELLLPQAMTDTAATSDEKAKMIRIGLPLLCKQVS
jgi:hypothetical protein